MFARLRQAVFGRERGSLGARGERVAARRLRNAGFRVLGRNVRLAGGEIDLLCLDPEGSSLVVVEVKSRVLRAGDVDHTRDARRPEASITADKRARLSRLAQAAARDRRITPGGVNRLRIDVVAIDFDPAGKRVIDVRHYPSAVGVTTPGARSRSG